MPQPRPFFRLALALISSLVLGLFVSAAPMRAQIPAGSDLSRFIGRWQINPAKTKMGRNGPNGSNILRASNFTFIFVPEGNHARMDVYSDYPQPAPTRSATVVTDGSVLPCFSKPSCLTIGGDPKDQTYSFFQINPNVLIRLFYVKGEPYDYSTMSVSADGKTMALISWDPKTPEYQNIQVLEKQP